MHAEDIISSVKIIQHEQRIQQKTRRQPIALASRVGKSSILQKQGRAYVTVDCL